MLPNYTTEERAAIIAYARQQKIIKLQEARETYKQDYGLSIEKMWDKLAKEHGVRLGGHTKAPTAFLLGKFSCKVGVDDWENRLLGVSNETSSRKRLEIHQERLGKGNMESLRAMQGLLLEGL